MDDCIFTIFEYLNLEDSYSYALTCQSYYKISNQELVWKKYLTTLIDNDTIKTLWNGNYKLTYKRCHQLNIVKRIFNLPNPIGEVYNLDTIQYRYTDITSIPKAINVLINLTRLDLQDNKLTCIPKEIANLTNLEWLNIANNQLVTIPNEIKLLPKISILYVHQTPPIHIPPEIITLPDLQILNQYLAQ